VTGITAGLDEGLKHNIDVDAFSNRVEDLFKWYDDGKSSQYMAPYFPVIQSSGTGKTRLFKEFRKTTVYECKIILCSFADPEPDSKNFFDVGLILPKNEGTSDDHAEIKNGNFRFFELIDKEF
jgi:hypothetical protein